MDFDIQYEYIIKATLGNVNKINVPLPNTASGWSEINVSELNRYIDFLESNELEPSRYIDFWKSTNWSQQGASTFQNFKVKVETY